MTGPASGPGLGRSSWALWRAAATLFFAGTSSGTDAARGRGQTRAARGQIRVASRDAAEQPSVGASIPLRLCNAYPFKLGLDVFHTPGRTPGAVGNVAPVEPEEGQLLTRSGPLGYKHCRDLQPSGNPLGPGSLLSFRFPGSLEVGAFQVSGWPAGGALLQIAIHRHDTWTAAAAFTSHVFSGGRDPEVAIVDAYRGEDTAFLELRGSGATRERLRFGTAVTMPPGAYECALLEGGGAMGAPEGRSERAVLALELADGGKYTLLRIGVEALEGPSYPEGLVLWPAAGLGGASDFVGGGLWAHSGTCARRFRGGAWLAVAAAVAWTCRAL